MAALQHFYGCFTVFFLVFGVGSAQALAKGCLCDLRHSTVLSKGLVVCI